MIEYQVRVYPDGTTYWYLNGKLHREDGPAVEDASGSKYWYLNGKLHREDGPAREWVDGRKYWFLNGQLHREDGPAVEHTDGRKYWFLNGKELSEGAFLRRTRPESQIISDLREVAEQHGYKLAKE